MPATCTPADPGPGVTAQLRRAGRPRGPADRRRELLLRPGAQRPAVAGDDLLPRGGGLSGQRLDRPRLAGRLRRRAGRHAAARDPAVHHPQPGAWAGHRHRAATLDPAAADALGPLVRLRADAVAAGAARHRRGADGVDERRASNNIVWKNLRIIRPAGHQSSDRRGGGATSSATRFDVQAPVTLEWTVPARLLTAGLVVELDLGADLAARLLGSPLRVVTGAQQVGPTTWRVTASKATIGGFPMKAGEAVGIATRFAGAPPRTARDGAARAEHAGRVRRRHRLPHRRDARRRRGARAGARRQVQRRRYDHAPSRAALGRPGPPLSTHGDAAQVL